MADSFSNDNTTCIVCFKNVLYYSVGECDHPVCFECSTRMRVLCQQNECPICRQTLAKVVFTDTVYSFKELRNRPFTDRLFERQYKIGFCTEVIKQAYEKLLENNCKLCDKGPPFRTFSMLNDHMRKVHERYFCDLCVKHLKIFTNERKCYTRQELAHHRRKGDLDDTSHRGHPLCEFCEERFMDADELYRHLRKEHLYCHLCDADGKNLYYATHAALAHHFRQDHFLCEEGECVGQHLTAVFRSDIDLKAHKATIHNKNMTRGASRQARTLELQFHITPHVGLQRTTPRERERERTPSPPMITKPDARIDPCSDEQFPRLCGAGPAAPSLRSGPSSNIASHRVSNLARTNKNFPALDGNGSRPVQVNSNSGAPVSAVLKNSKPNVSIHLASQPASASNFRLTHPTGSGISIPQQRKQQQPSANRENRDDFHDMSDLDDFPALGGRDDYPSIGAGSQQPSKVSLINSQDMKALKKNHQSFQPKKVALSSEAFPALSSTSTPSAPPKWITVSKTKEKEKPKAEPPPQPKKLSINAVADFPGLPANKNPQKNKKLSPTFHAPVPKPPEPKTNKINTPQPNKINTPQPSNKKEKKKQQITTRNLENEDPVEINHLNYDKYSMSTLLNNNNQTVSDKKIKTIDDASTVTANSDKNKNSNSKFAMKATDYPPLTKLAASDIPKLMSYGPSKKVTNGHSGNSKSRPKCDGMTFTNSSGQTFPAPVHAYIPPSDFEHRNIALVKKFTSAFKDSDALECFKVASRAFRDNIITADDFYEHCKTALGDHLENVFGELVALLPDIAKQQELVLGREAAFLLEVCPTCGQVLAPSDSISHDTAHWPALS